VIGQGINYVRLISIASSYLRLCFLSSTLRSGLLNSVSVHLF
jgi:hypothetical protein